VQARTHAAIEYQNSVVENRKKVGWHKFAHLGQRGRRSRNYRIGINL